MSENRDIREIDSEIGKTETIGKLEVIKNYLHDHAFEFKVMAIGVAVSFGIGLVLTGDFQEALAGRHRR